MKQRSALIWLWASVAIIILDQYTKYLVTDALVLNEVIPIFTGLNLTLVHNDGAAFSFLRGAGGWQRWFFVSLSSVISIGIIIWLARLPPHRNWLAAALAFIVGGALGNLWDRLAHGYVIDFIHVYYDRWHWPAFNVADSAITVGAIMLIIDALWLDRAEVSIVSKRDGS